MTSVHQKFVAFCIVIPVLLQDVFIRHIVLAEEMGQINNIWSNFLVEWKMDTIVGTNLTRVDSIIVGLCGVGILWNHSTKCLTRAQRGAVF